MIVKSLSRSSASGSTGQLLQYILRYATQEKKQEVREKQSKEKPFIIRHNIRTRSVTGYVREFRELESLRQYKHSHAVAVYHFILSLSSKDRAQVTDAMLKDLAEKFIELRGQDNLFIGTKHEDKEHVHLHLAMSAIDVAGRSARISKAAFAQLKLELDRYQTEQYPELFHSLPEHGRKSKAITQETIRQQAKLERASHKEELLATLDKCQSGADSLDAFLASLVAEGYTPYYRSGELTGITTEEGRKFRLATLGYDPAKLQKEYQELERQGKELAELRELRQHSALGRTILQTEVRDERADASLEDKALEELQSLRESTSDSRNKEDEREDEDDALQAEEREEDISREDTDNDRGR